MPTKPKPVLPAEARKKWKSSTVASPITVCRGLFTRSPKALDLVARAVAAGVSRRTATVAFSKLRHGKL